MNRRAFLKNAALLSVAGTGVTACRQSSQPEKKIKLGCFNRPWNQWTLDRALDGIQQAGFRYFGLLRQQRKHVILQESVVESCWRVESLMKQRGLQFLMAYPPVNYSGSPNEVVSDNTLLFQELQQIGCPYILNGGLNDPEMFGQYYNIMRAYADAAQAYNIHVVVKPHTPPGRQGVSSSGAVCAETVRKVNHSNFRVCYDPANIFHSSGADPVEDVKDVAEYVTAMCLKDYQTVGREKTNYNVTPGFGEVDYPAVFDILSQHSFAGPCLIEMLDSGTPEEVDTAARKGYEYFMNFI